MGPAPRHPLVGVAGLAVAVAVAWWLLAPQAIGGSMAYLVVRGSSMAPGFGPGDLVVVREGPSYGPGDVVAYRAPDADAGDEGVGDEGSGGAPGSGEGPVIVHRVVDVDGERLVLRGDANDLDDAIRPTPDEVLGREVLVVPGVGRLVAGVADHVLAVGLVGTGVLAGAIVMAGPGRRRPPDAPSAGADAPSAGADAPSAGADAPSAGADAPAAGAAAGPEVGWSAGDGGQHRSDPIVSLAVGRPGPPWLWLVLALGVAVAAVAVVRTPATSEERVAEPWSVRTSFGWDAPPSGDPVAEAVYGEDGLRTGDTVFTAATPILGVQVAATLSTSIRSSDVPPLADDVTDGGGAAGGMDTLENGSFVAEAAVVSDAGWRRPVVALDPLSLEGGWASGELSVNLADAWATAWATGAVAGRLGEVHLEVVATTTAGDGAVAASAVQTFVLDAVSAVPLPPEARTPPDGVDTGTADAGVAAAASPGAGAEGLAAPGSAAAMAGGDRGVEGAAAPTGSVVTDGAIERAEVVAAEVSFGPLSVSRMLAGVLVVTAAVVVLVGGMVSVVATGRARRRGEASLLVTRHRGSLVPLYAAPAPLGGDPTEVASFAALRRVADTVGQPIGVTCLRGAAAFWVTDGVRVWRYRAFPG